MKKSVLLLATVLLVSVVSVNAQSYIINKNNYNYKDYTPQIGDPYTPGLCGAASFFIPGLGQMISGEVGRGFAFLGGSAACGVVYGVGAYQFMSSMDPGNLFYTGRVKGVGTMLVGIAGLIVVDIWSIVDAVKVAKVNNMYVRDKSKTSSLTLGVEPYVANFNVANQQVTPVGLTVKVGF